MREKAAVVLFTLLFFAYFWVFEADQPSSPRRATFTDPHTKSLEVKQGQIVGRSVKRPLSHLRRIKEEEAG